MVEQLKPADVAAPTSTESHDAVHTALLKDASTPMPATSAKSDLPPPPPGAPAAANDSVAHKLGREAVLVGGTLGESVVNGLYHLPEKIPQLGESLAIGAALNAVSQMGTPGRIAAWVAGAALTTRFVVNTYNDKERWSEAGQALSDTWKSNEHLGKNIDKLSNSAGSFAFDTATFAGASYLGYSNANLGHGILNVLRLPVPAIPLAPIALPGMVLGVAPQLPDFHSTNHNSGDYNNGNNSNSINFKFNVDVGRLHIDDYGHVIIKDQTK